MAVFTSELLQILKLGYYFWPIFFVFSLIYSCIYYFATLWLLRKNLKWIPGPPTTPLLGNSLSFLGRSWTDHWNTTTEWLDKYNGLLQIWIFHRPTLVTSRSDIVEKLLKGLADTLTSKGEQYRFLNNYIGEGLLTKLSVYWNQRRKLLNPYFHQETANRNVSSMSYQARALTSHLKEKEHNEIIDLQQFVQFSSLDVTMDLLMQSTQSTQENKSYIEASKSATETAMKRTYTPLFGWKIFYLFTMTKLIETRAVRTINKIANKIINKRIKARQEEKNRLEEDGSIQNVSSSFLDYLLDKQEKEFLTPNDVKDEVKTFLFAAHETVSSGIAFTLYLIGRHPTIQNQLLQEIRTVLPDLNSEKEPTVSQLNALEQLERCIMESIRLFPPVPWIGRQLKNSIKIDESCTLPGGVNVAISIYKLHRNEKYYNYPNQFNPDRFLQYNQDCESYTYIPFGAGWRSCIGQKLAMLEMKIIISHILNEYSISSLDRPEDLQITGNIILRSANGLRVKLCPRNK